MRCMTNPTPPAATFPTWARLALGLLVGLLGYLVAGELRVDEDLRAAITALTLLLASAGIVPPTIRDLPPLSPTTRFVLTAFVTALAYIVNVIDASDLDPTARGLIVAALALAASLGIVPPQTGRTR